MVGQIVCSCWKLRIRMVPLDAIDQFNLLNCDLVEGTTLIRHLKKSGLDPNRRSAHRPPATHASRSYRPASESKYQDGDSSPSHGGRALDADAPLRDSQGTDMQPASTSPAF